MGHLISLDDHRNVRNGRMSWSPPESLANYFYCAGTKHSRYSAVASEADEGS